MKWILVLCGLFWGLCVAGQSDSVKNLPVDSSGIKEKGKPEINSDITLKKNFQLDTQLIDIDRKEIENSNIKKIRIKPGKPEVPKLKVDPPEVKAYGNKNYFGTKIPRQTVKTSGESENDWTLVIILGGLVLFAAGGQFLFKK